MRFKKIGFRVLSLDPEIRVEGLSTQVEIKTLIIDAILCAHILINDARESKSCAISIPESFQK